MHYRINDHVALRSWPDIGFAIYRRGNYGYGTDGSPPRETHAIAYSQPALHAATCIWALAPIRNARHCAESAGTARTSVHSGGRTRAKRTPLRIVGRHCTQLRAFWRPHASETHAIAHSRLTRTSASPSPSSCPSPNRRGTRPAGLVGEDGMGCETRSIDSSLVASTRSDRRLSAPPKRSAI